MKKGVGVMIAILIDVILCAIIGIKTGIVRSNMNMSVLEQIGGAVILLSPVLIIPSMIIEAIMETIICAIFGIKREKEEIKPYDPTTARIEDLEWQARNTTDPALKAQLRGQAEQIRLLKSYKEVNK